MEFINCSITAGFFLLLCSSVFDLGSSTDTITASQIIKDSQVIISSGNKFKLGFFSPENSTHRYVGIWYSNISITTPIWVANRNRPLQDSSGIMTISEDGNLVVLNGQREILWSTNVSVTVANSSALLTKDGNLVLRGGINGNSEWESFQQPSNTFLPGMKLSANAKTGKKIMITSWKSPSDPSVGSFSGGISPTSIPELFVWNGTHPYWRSGPWNGQVFIGIPGMSSSYLSGVNVVKDADKAFTFSFINPFYSILDDLVVSEGKLTERSWDYDKAVWDNQWQIPQSDCDIYGKCGSFGICDARNSAICSCLKGFDPKNTEEWNSGNWTSGCFRRKLLQCERNQNGSEGRKEDEFLKLVTVKVPDFGEWSSSSPEQNCKDECLSNCACIAYAYYTGFGCLLWRGSLIDIQKISGGGADLYIRLEYSELGNISKVHIIIGLIVAVGAVIVSLCLFMSWRWIVRHRGWREWKVKIGKISVSIEEEHSMISDWKVQVEKIYKDKLLELPLYSLEKLATATNNFDVSNTLGRGGFGQVYKGIMPDGESIAVKRLSRSSRQGLKEFMNEVFVISKLQHRNLVRLLGCCVEGEENMLVYEYMPNKSLDAFLFEMDSDPEKQKLLPWRKRLNIIEGISRGLLYLHRDSRLRIIHRDLKAANILLDQELNPKISDFGMARIFGGDEARGNTGRVVGTYGYMSPEYALKGEFSEKSDVFSLGVLILEIVSGRRNSSFGDNTKAWSLTGFAWELWSEGKIEDLIDPTIFDPCFLEKLHRCIHLGLLCVQEYAEDRPAVPAIISMLNSEIMELPAPQQIAFVARNRNIDAQLSHQSQRTYSVNDVTLTDVAGR